MGQGSLCLRNNKSPDFGRMEIIMKRYIKLFTVAFMLIIIIGACGKTVAQEKPEQDTEIGRAHV